MEFTVILLALAFVFALALVASVILTRFSKADRVQRASVAELAEEGGRAGELYWVEGEVRLMEFEGLHVPSALLLVDGEARLQLADPDGLLGVRGAEGASLLPSEASSLSGMERMLGRYRAAGTYEDVPVRHLRIRALHEVGLVGESGL